MPYAGEDFSNATVGETITYFIDFTPTLATGETITGASVTSAVAVNSTTNDPSAAAVATGPASISGNIVGQKFAGMVLNVTYLVTFIANTSQGNEIICYSHFFTDQPN
jgi:hypothetical protein